MAQGQQCARVHSHQFLVCSSRFRVCINTWAFPWFASVFLLSTWWTWTLDCAVFTEEHVHSMRPPSQSGPVASPTLCHMGGPASVWHSYMGQLPRLPQYLAVMVAAANGPPHMALCTVEKYKQLDGDLVW